MIGFRNRSLIKQKMYQLDKNLRRFLLMGFAKYYEDNVEIMESRRCNYDSFEQNCLGNVRSNYSEPKRSVTPSYRNCLARKANKE